ncbi:heavy-metal-associated domain-containing protein [Aliiruegeria lutimaris]|uniref:Copper chaperone n=1 Tax=Aliiruegeria lutimaris TaxID=571298 RepID=A0A1G8JYR4_9RHOB|nr:cation transporter [Aliiruegeria lutimaris]SDI36308.1 copper chaperone [Aliiruegeria lutimaris]
MKFNVPDMSCGHCTAAIEKAILEADSSANVTCDLDSRSVTIESGLQADAVAKLLLDAGYEAEAA